MGGPDEFDDRIEFEIEFNEGSGELHIRLGRRLDAVMKMINKGLDQSIVTLKGADELPIIVQNNARAMAVIRCTDSFLATDETAEVTFNNIENISVEFSHQDDLIYHFSVTCTFSLFDSDTVSTKTTTLAVRDFLAESVLDSLGDDAVSN